MLAILIVTDVGHDSCRQAEARGCAGGVWAVSNGVNEFSVSVGNLVSKTHGNHGYAIFVLKDSSILQVNEIVVDNVANGKKIK